MSADRETGPHATVTPDGLLNCVHGIPAGPRSSTMCPWVADPASGDPVELWEKHGLHWHGVRGPLRWDPEERSVVGAAWLGGTDLRFDDRGRLLDTDGRPAPAHEPVTYLPDRQWTRLRDTDVEIYHAGDCPCSRERVWVRHRAAVRPDPVILASHADHPLAGQVQAVLDEEGVEGVAEAIRRVMRGGDDAARG